MKKEIIIASLAPAFWVLVGIYHIGMPRPDHVPGECFQGDVVLDMAIIAIPCAIIAYLAGQSSKDE